MTTYKPGDYVKVGPRDPQPGDAMYAGFIYETSNPEISFTEKELREMDRHDAESALTDPERVQGSIRRLEGGWPYVAPDKVRADVDGTGNVWLTKDSGERAEFEGGGQRDTQEGKPRFDLLLPLSVPYEYQMLTRWAALMARGAEKYEDRNWEQFSDEEAYNRAKSSGLRHHIQYVTGESDEDHAAAVMFNLTAAEYVRGVLEGRWPALPDPEHRAILWGIKQTEAAA